MINGRRYVREPFDYEAQAVEARRIMVQEAKAGMDVPTMAQLRILLRDVAPYEGETREPTMQERRALERLA